MTEPNKLDQFIKTYPRQSLQMLVLGLALFFQSVAAVLGLLIYVVSKKKNISALMLCVPGMVVFSGSVLLQTYTVLHGDIVSYFIKGFKLNIGFWKLLVANKSVDALWFMWVADFNYLVALPLIVGGILRLTDLIQDNPHKKIMKDLQEGVLQNKVVELSDQEINTALKKIDESSYDGTVLGVSKYTGEVAVIPDKYINQVVLVLGTTGGGKTVTLRRFYRRAITQGYPLIIVDGKPDDANIDWLMKHVEQNGRSFIGFNCGNFLAYDPLAEGGYTELKDKIISLKDEWSSDHYRSIAEDYLQTTLEVLIKSGQPFDLKTVVDYLNYENLTMLARKMKDPLLTKRVMSLNQYDRKDITGLQAHLNILIHSELGQFFEKNETTFTLTDVIQQNAVVYFALPALRFPSFSKVLGKLVINDIKAVIDRHNNPSKKIFTIFDEFSVFAGEQVLNLVNMGRGKGVHAIFGTQGLADLDKVDVNFKNQVLNCANTLICHRLNDKDSAETVANWIGTKDVFTLTAQLNGKEADAQMGSVRVNKEFIVHPDQIKQGLGAGECFSVGKVGNFAMQKIKIKHELSNF